MADKVKHTGRQSEAVANSEQRGKERFISDLISAGPEFAACVGSSNVSHHSITFMENGGQDDSAIAVRNCCSY